MEFQFRFKKYFFNFYIPKLYKKPYMPNKYLDNFSDKQHNILWWEISKYKLVKIFVVLATKFQNIFIPPEIEQKNTIRRLLAAVALERYMRIKFMESKLRRSLSM